jgi:hypothetical protein
MRRARFESPAAAEYIAARGSILTVAIDTIIVG